jgi:hypothetical protein
MVCVRVCAMCLVCMVYVYDGVYDGVCLSGALVGALAYPPQVVPAAQRLARATLLARSAPARCIPLACAPWQYIMQLLFHLHVVVVRRALVQS